MKKEKRKIFLSNCWLVVFVLLPLGCVFWAKQGFDYDTAEVRLPLNMRIFLKEAQGLDFQNLNSLASFVELHREFAVFDDEIQRYKIDQKHMADFARAYDGDTIAFLRLLSAMDSKDDWEVLHLFFVLSELDSVKPVKKLRELTKVSRGARKNNYIEALNIHSRQNVLFAERIKYLNNIRQKSIPLIKQAERKLKFDSVKVESLLKKGIDNFTLQNFDSTEYILSDIVRNGDMRQYCRAREIIIDILPLFDSSELLRRVYNLRFLLAYPSPDDTINETSSVQEVIYVIKNEICDANAILLEDKIDSSIVKTICGNVFVTDNRYSLQMYSNINGKLECRSLKLSVYEDYANVEIGYFEVTPCWKEHWFYLSNNKLSEAIHLWGTSGGSTSFHLQRINGIWKEIGRRISIVS